MYRRVLIGEWVPLADTGKSSMGLGVSLFKGAVFYIVRRVSVIG
jgi:hypothetical protein